MLTVHQILTNQLKSAKSKIESTFDSQQITAVGSRQLQVLLQKNHSNWELSPDISFTKFLNFMLKHTKLREITLSSADYGSQTRYVWRTPSIYAIALSLKGNSYLSHETAVFLHGLRGERQISTIQKLGSYFFSKFEDLKTLEFAILVLYAYHPKRDGYEVFMPSAYNPDVFATVAEVSRAILVNRL